MFDRLKSIVLFILVINSLVLSGMLIFYSPNSENVSISEYLPRPKIGGIKDYSDLIPPNQIIYHFGNNDHTIVKRDTHPYSIVVNDMNQWSFYDFIKEDKIDWTDLIQNKRGVEIVFPDHLTETFFASNFRVISTNISLNDINRIWIYYDDEKVKALFISDDRNEVYKAQTSITNKKLSQFIIYAIGQIKYTYYSSFPIENNEIVRNFFYLPNQKVAMKKVTKSFNTVSIGDFISLLFIDPSLVRKVDMENKKNLLFTDGNRSLQFFSKENYIYYFQPSSDNNGVIEIDRDLYTALRFINQHGGWDGVYSINKIATMVGSNNQTLVEFQRYLDGYPIFDNSFNYGSMQVQMNHGFITSFKRSLILPDNNIETKVIKTITKEELLVKINEMGILEQDIHSIDLGYAVTVKQSTIVFDPVWRILTSANRTIEIPAYEGVMY